MIYGLLFLLSALAVITKLEIRSDTEDKFTIMIPTYKRVNYLLRNQELIRYSELPSVDKIIISWNDNTKDPPEELVNYLHSASPKFKVIKREKNSLLNRYITTDIDTEAVFSLDDDQCITAESVERMFHVWLNHTNSLVGSFKRSARCKVDTCVYMWGGFKRWNLLLPGGGLFCHKKYYDNLLQNPDMEDLRAIIDKTMNGEDILLNLAHPYEVYPPVYVPSTQCKVKIPIDRSGLSFRKSHITERSNFVATALKSLGKDQTKLPLYN